RWGPGTRIPAIIVGPTVKRGFVDHTEYDTTSILKLLTERFGLEELDGIKNRDLGLLAHANPPLGDFSTALSQ
ncbi:MAG TPA: alkaline phosphatase family protein, partial [Dongiaceae bacterium]